MAPHLDLSAPGQDTAVKNQNNSEGTQMLLPRRAFLQLAASAVALPAVKSASAADTYPSRSARVIVGFAPGGGNDIVGRLMAQWLSDRLGQPFIVDNRPGAGTNIAAELVINSPPDGYNILLAGIPNAVNATMYRKLNFDFIRDTTPIVGVMSIPNAMVVNPTFPARTLDEFVAYAKANPGKVNMASPGVGSGGHLSGELFKYLAGVDLTHVPFRGNGPALVALLGGQVDVLFPSISSASKYVKDGKLRAIGVTSAKRAEALPDVPAIGEVVKDYDMVAWYGFVGPKGTPANVVDKINKEINLALADPGIKARLAANEGTSMGGSSADFERLIADETKKWAKVITAAHLAID
jgi:tripartite-type tricarboxylate transporter receptor subunit TctC